jgi:hypothetical protein
VKGNLANGANEANDPWGNIGGAVAISGMA